MYLVLMWLVMALFCAEFSRAVQNAVQPLPAAACHAVLAQGRPSDGHGRNGSVVSRRIGNTALRLRPVVGRPAGLRGVLYLSPSLGFHVVHLACVAPSHVYGMAAFEVGVSLRTAIPTNKESSRLARPQATTVSDYVSPWRLLLAPVFGPSHGAVRLRSSSRASRRDRHGHVHREPRPRHVLASRWSYSSSVTGCGAPDPAPPATGQRHSGTRLG